MDYEYTLAEWQALGIAQVRWLELRWREGQGGSVTIYHCFAPDERAHRTTYPLTQARMTRLNDALRGLKTHYGYTLVLAGGGMETMVDVEKRSSPI